MLSEGGSDFTTLPRELQVLILSKLDLLDLLATTRVCRFLYNLIRRTPALQYPIELVACGMRDNADSGTAIAQRLDNLRQHDGAWRTLRWSNDIEIRIPSGGGMRSKQGLILVLKEMAHPEMGIHVEQLPSITRNVPHQFWTIQPAIDSVGGEGPREGEVYEVDPSQDLLIIRHGATPANTFFNVYTLSEGLPHPQAALQSFRISNSGSTGGFGSMSAGALIRRDWVYLLDDSVEIYNWKTGERGWDYNRRGTLTDCAFLDDMHMAAVVFGVNRSPAVLLIYELPSSDPSVPYRYPPTIPVLAFFLPEIDDETPTEWGLVGGSAQSAARSSRASGGDFSTNSDETLVLIPFRVRDRDYELIVTTQRLLGFLPHPGNISMVAGMYSLRDVEWPEWGPQNAHVRQAAPSVGERDRLQAGLFGMRYVLRHPVRSDDGEMFIRVHDYQPSRVHWAEANESASQTVHRVHLARGEWRTAGDMQTELPYVETQMELPLSWQDKDPQSVDVSIHEDGLMLTDRSTGEAYSMALTF